VATDPSLSHLTGLVMMLFGSRSPMASMLRQLRRAREVLVSFAGRLPPEVEAALEERRADARRVELLAQRPYDVEALASLLAKGFMVHPQELASAEVVIVNRHSHYALETGERLPADSALTCRLLATRGEEMVAITGRARRCDDRAGILILEELEHYTFDVRCRLSVTRGQWVRVLGVRPLSPFVPTYLPHTVQALEVVPLMRHAEGGAPGHAILVEEVPPRVLEQWEAVLSERGFLDLWDAAGYLQQHRIHPEESLRSAAPGASRLVVWALTAAAALALQQGTDDLTEVRTEVERGVGLLAAATAGEDGLPAGWDQRMGLAAEALYRVVDAAAREVVTAVQRESVPRRTGLSTRTGA
jgi:hypothetical protein